MNVFSRFVYASFRKKIISCLVSTTMCYLVCANVLFSFGEIFRQIIKLFFTGPGQNLAWKDSIGPVLYVMTQSKLPDLTIDVDYCNDFNKSSFINPSVHIT